MLLYRVAGNISSLIQSKLPALKAVEIEDLEHPITEELLQAIKTLKLGKRQDRGGLTAQLFVHLLKNSSFTDF